jgi:hypothetical protein
MEKDLRKNMAELARLGWSEARRMNAPVGCTMREVSCGERIASLSILWFP